jgi:hypothetical protein
MRLSDALSISSWKIKSKQAVFVKFVADFSSKSAAFSVVPVCFESFGKSEEVKLSEVTYGI